MIRYDIKRSSAECNSIERNSAESSYLMYLDANNLYGWAMSQKLPVDGFKWVKKLSKFNERFIKDYDENSYKEYFPKVDVEYPKNLLNGVALNGIAFSGAALNLHSDLPFLPERNKIKKCNKLVCNIQDKENYVVRIRALRQALNHGLIFKNYIK